MDIHLSLFVCLNYNVEEMEYKKMKKKVLIILKSFLVILFGVFLFNELSGPSMSLTDFAVVENNVMKKMTDYDLEKQSRQTIKKNLGIDPSNYENIVYFKSQDPMDVREIVIVKFKDINQGDKFKEAMLNRIDGQIKAFNGYGVDQVGLLKKAVVSVDMNYAIYVTCDKANNVISLYKEQL